MPLVSRENEYDDALRYDAEYGHFQGDFPFFHKLCRSFERKIDILDLGCGTGRLTFALASYAKTIFGIDQSDSMLQRAKEKEQQVHDHTYCQPHSSFSSKNVQFPIMWQQSDLCSFSLKKTFDLITMSGNTFQALLTEEDQRKALLCVKNHMKKESIFVFNLRNPKGTDLASHDDFKLWHTFKDQEGRTIYVHGRQTYDAESQIMHYETMRIYPDFTRISPLDLRFTEQSELDTHLKDMGFKKNIYYGDFDESNFTSESASMICVCTF